MINFAYPPPPPTIGREAGLQIAFSIAFGLLLQPRAVLLLMALKSCLGLVWSASSNSLPLIRTHNRAARILALSFLQDALEFIPVLVGPSKSPVWAWTGFEPSQKSFDSHPSVPAQVPSTGLSQGWCGKPHPKKASVTTGRFGGTLISLKSLRSTFYTSSFQKEQDFFGGNDLFYCIDAGTHVNHPVSFIPGETYGHGWPPRRTQAFIWGTDFAQ